MHRFIRISPWLQPVSTPFRQNISNISPSFIRRNARPTSRFQLLSERGNPFRRSYSYTSPHGVDPTPKIMVVRTIIGLNAGVFAAWVYARATSNSDLWMTMIQNFTISLGNISAGRWWTGLTSAFSHMMLFHVMFNMMAFNALATVFALTLGVGTLSLVALCLGSAIAGSVASIIDDRRKTAGRPQSAAPERTALGASGMVMGVGSAAACLMPFLPMNIMFIPVAIPLWAVMALYAGVDMFFLHSERSFIGHAAHLGGSSFGVLYYFTFLRRFGGVAHMFARSGRRLRH